MRLSLRRVVQWISIIVLLQVAVYYWTIKRTSRLQRKVRAHKFLESIAGDDGTCSFKTCPHIKEGMINVHLVPHSHMDVGWLKTVDQYYTGEDVPNVSTVGCVRCTLNSTIAELLKHPERRFIFIEMKYLSRYWHESDEAQRKIIRKLIKERRLEIVNGGWVMSDAGVTMYNDIIDQHTLGFDFIRDTFGPCGHSRTGWHVDQFGHSSEHASIFAQMGYDSLFIGRIDFQDLAERKIKKNLECVWEASPHNLKERSTIFTQATYDGYYAPSEYVFENNNYLLLSENNALERSANNFARILSDRARSFKTNHLLVPMGSDFGYRDASIWFSNMDALIRTINAMQDDSKGMRLNMVYSTPSCYTYHVNQVKEVFARKKDDFHPYGIDPGVYWAGYFTTRGGFKMHIRKAGQILQILTDSIGIAGDALSVMQHHDAITGTQKLLVLHDYNLELSKAEDQSLAVISMAYQKLWNPDKFNGESSSDLKTHFCHDLNISSCDVSENSDQFVATIYSPLSWHVDVSVRFPIRPNHVTLTDWKGHQIPAQIVPVPDGILNIPERTSVLGTEVVFNVRLPPMSSTSYTIKSTGDGFNPTFLASSTSDLVIENQHLSLTFNATTGKLVSIYNKDIKIKETASQDFFYYIGQNNSPRPSGAYVFVPRDAEPVIIAPEKVEIKVIKGDIVQEVHQKFSTWVYQIVRLYDGAKHAEFQWVVGPLDDKMGREVISRFTTGLNSADTFYTDSNGREVIKRTRQKPGGVNTKVKDFVSGNYYPIPSRVFIQDEKTRLQLTVITDRSQGGSSLASGSVELMVHRRLLFDDGLGVSEALKDVGIDNKGIIFTGKHYVCLDSVDNSVLLTKHLALQTHFAPVSMFTPVNGSQFNTPFKQHTFLSAPLPDNIQILTLDRISESSPDLYLLRLEHVFEVDENSVLSQPVEVSLQNLFQPFEIVSAEETTLGGNFRPHEISRLEWDTFDGRTQSSILSPDYEPAMEQPFRIKLQPMEIRTFRVQVATEL